MTISPLLLFGFSMQLFSQTDTKSHLECLTKINLLTYNNCISLNIVAYSTIVFRWFVQSSSYVIQLEFERFLRLLASLHCGIKNSSKHIQDMNELYWRVLPPLTIHHHLFLSLTLLPISIYTSKCYILISESMVSYCISLFFQLFHQNEHFGSLILMITYSRNQYKGLHFIKYLIIILLAIKVHTMILCVNDYRRLWMFVQ